MGKHCLLILIQFLLFHLASGQDSLRISATSELLNKSIADRFTLYESDAPLSFDDFLKQKPGLKKTKLTTGVANLDFTSKTYFLDFVLINDDPRAMNLVLETARPITNTVNLFDFHQRKVVQSGDGIPFDEKAIKTNSSALPISLGSKDTARFILQLGSDGEIISLPFVLRTKNQYQEQKRDGQFLMGIFFGIFLFVVIIYFTFYSLLRDSLFLFYSLYVLSSGLLQFALDGYFHRYFFKSGQYWTQHIVILVAGFTVFFALQYASRYLKLQGRLRKLSTWLSWTVLATNGLSLIPGIVYELCYPLINGFSFLVVVYLVIVALRIRKNNISVSPLFIAGLSVLLLGAILFILGNFSIINFPVITQNALRVGTLAEILCLSILMAGKYKTLQEEKESAQRALLVELEAKNKLMSEANVRLEEEVALRTHEIEEQRSKLKEKNEDLVASITYAERIQRALLLNETKFKTILPDSFIFHQPKDIVSGDFYWIEQFNVTEDQAKPIVAYATADCTGHGVPGAFVSIICNNLLASGISNSKLTKPGKILDRLSAAINAVLNSNYGSEQIRDGMDLCFCIIDQNQQKMWFSGAKNNVYILRRNELLEFKGDRKSIGEIEVGEFNYATIEIPLETGDTIYTLSDGFTDQFGGDTMKKYTIKRFKELISSIVHEPLEEQQKILKMTFDTWTNGNEQTDDVLVIGVRIT